MPRRPAILLVLTVALLVAAGLVLRFTMEHPEPPPAVSAPSLPAFIAPAPPKDPAQQLGREVAGALGYAPDVLWDQRLALLRNLPNDPGPDEISALLTALMERCPPGVSTAVHSTYMHEIACILQRLPAARERFAQALASLARDLRRDATTRDYAIQHLRQVWERARDNAALQTSITATFRELTTLDPAVSTAALLSLHLLGSSPGEVARDSPPGTMPQAVPTPASARGSFALLDTEIVPLLEPVFAEQTTLDNIPARLTAARIAGERRLADFRSSLLAQVTNPSEHALIRMAAVNALGRIGHPDDLATLAAYNPGDDRVAAALQHALGARHH